MRKTRNIARGGASASDVDSMPPGKLKKIGRNISRRQLGPDAESKLTANCVCAICKNNKDFQVPQQLLDALKRGDVVIFAGAGISTEKKTVYPYTLYEDVAGELKGHAASGGNFPTLMSAYCLRPDGRKKLVQKVKERFDYIRSFPEIYREATRFHRELSGLLPVSWTPS